MPKYIVVRSADMFLFEEQVSKKLEEGYRPIGGLVVGTDKLHGSIYYQAMML